MHSDSKTKNLDKNKINKSSIELLKKSPLINSYLIRRKNKNSMNPNSEKVSNAPAGRASVFHKTVQTVINMMKNKDSNAYFKGNYHNHSKYQTALDLVCRYQKTLLEFEKADQ